MAASVGDKHTAERVEGATEHAYARYADLCGRHVFITGGGSGIGAYFVDAFAAQGAQVSFVALDDAVSRALCDAVEAGRGVRPRFAACDVRDVCALESIICELTQQIGPVTVLINNAARDDRHTLESLGAGEWDDSVNTNLRHYFFAAKAIAGAMRTARAGSIINVGSNCANLGLAGYPAYVAAKAGVVGLTRALARELGPGGIRVNALIPGWVLTQRQRALWATPEAVAECVAQQCLRRVVQGRDVADAALFLASNAAAMVTGQSLVVDGGRAMQ